MILRTERSGTMQEIEGFLHRMGISLEELQVVAQINDSELLRFCIVQGLGISILSRRMVEDFIRQERILAVPLGEESLVRHLYMIYREDDYMPDLIKLFVDMLNLNSAVALPDWGVHFTSMLVCCFLIMSFSGVVLEGC